MPKDARSLLRHNYHDLVRTDVTPHVPKSGGTLLDLGGGTGATADYLKRNGHADRIGVVDMVEPGQGGPELDFSYQGDLEDSAFIDSVIAEQGPFNLVLLLDTLEHLVDPWSLVAQLHSGLAPGGVIVASIPNVRNYTVILPLMFRNRWTLLDAGILDRTHLRFFVRSSAIELMTNSGLTVESVNTSASGGRKVALFRRLTFGLLNSFTDRQYIVCVRRVGPES
jgi:2-polyprenyl-3-methyl-5-hydroxy-6-metoxy-1,4-benzoquinol methylase